MGPKITEMDKKQNKTADKAYPKNIFKFPYKIALPCDQYQIHLWSHSDVNVYIAIAMPILTLIDIGIWTR
jgi:hypothetical protein